MPKREKTEKDKAILEQAALILYEEGAQGLTMRKVASATEISLGHLQYYFSNKNALLKALITSHLEECEEKFSELPLPVKSNPEKAIEKFIFELLLFESDCMEVVLFKEFWAIASRNKEIEKHLHDFYTLYANDVFEYLDDIFPNKQERVKEAVTLLTPYSEGYFVMQEFTPHSRKQTAKLLTRIVVNLLSS